MGTHYNPKIITAGLILAFDAANAKSYTGTGTVFTDLSNKKTDGTFTPAPTVDSTITNGIVFPVNNYCDVTLPSIAGFTGTSKITIQLLYKWNSLQSGMFLGFTGYDVWTMGGALGYNIANSDLYGIPSATVTSLGLVGAYHNYAFVMPAASSIPVNGKIYVDGVVQPLSQILATTGNGAGFSGGNLRINGWKNGGYTNSATIAQILVYDRELGADEIMTNHIATKSRVGL